MSESGHTAQIGGGTVVPSAAPATPAYCAECGREVGVTPGGRLYPHKCRGGGWCPGGAWPHGETA